MNIDMQSYFNALQATDFSQQLTNQKLQIEQQKREALMPLSELSLGEGVKVLGEKAIEFAKSQGTQIVKDAVRSKLKDAGVDEDTINSTLEGDLSLDNLTSKVGSLISQAQTKAQGVVSDIQSQAEGIVSDIQSQVGGVVSDIQSQAEGLKQSFTDSLDNLQSTVKSNISDAQGVMDDLSSQALQEYNTMRSNFVEPTLMETETGTSNLISKVSNFFQSPQVQPTDIEMVNFAEGAPEVSSIAPEIGDVLSSATEAVTGAVSGATEAVTGAVAGLEGLSAGLDTTGVLAPVGALLGVIGGIFGIVESEKSPQEQGSILNPSSQFL
jgi:hypothetical protein